MEDSSIDASCCWTGQSRKVKQAHKVKRVHKGKRRHHRQSRKREARQMKHLIRWCAFYGLNPPDMDAHLFGLTRDDAVNDPLSPFVAAFRLKFRHYRIPKLSGRNSDGIKKRPAEPFDYSSYHLNMLPRDNSGPVPKKSSSLKGKKYFWNQPPSNDSSTTEEDDDVVDLDVLVLGPEIEDTFDLRLMSFCGMI